MSYYINGFRLLFTLVLAMSSYICTAQDSKNPQIKKGSKEQEILDLEISRLNAFANGDTNAFKNMVTEDLIIVHGSGSMLNRAQEISVMRPSTPDRPLPKLSIENARVNMYDNTAIMRGNLVETAADGRRELVLRFTNTYIKQEGQWRMAGSQLNTLSKERPTARIDSSLYNIYAGQYRIATGKIVNVLNEDGKLFIDGGSKTQLFPQSDTQFFIKGADALFVFIKDGNGQVVSLLNRQPNGDIIEGRKIK